MDDYEKLFFRRAILQILSAKPGRAGKALGYESVNAICTAV